MFCRLVETLDALLEMYDGDLEGTLRWLTAPKTVLANELPVELLITEAGKRVVQQDRSSFVAVAPNHGDIWPPWGWLDEYFRGRIM